MRGAGGGGHAWFPPSVWPWQSPCSCTPGLTLPAPPTALPNVPSHNFPGERRAQAQCHREGPAAGDEGQRGGAASTLVGAGVDWGSPRPPGLNPSRLLLSSRTCSSVTQSSASRRRRPCSTPTSPTSAPPRLQGWRPGPLLLSEVQAPVHISHRNHSFCGLGRTNLPPLLSGLPVAFFTSFPLKAALDVTLKRISS